MAQYKIFSKIVISILFCLSLQDKFTLYPAMEFKKLHNDIHCICTEKCVYNADDIFSLRTLKETLTEEDFMSYWDLGRRDTKNKGCGAKCALKAQSLSIHNNATSEYVKKIYIAIFPLTPAYVQFLSIIRFKDNCGVTKASPSFRNPHHYSFYKCDEFKLENVELISCVNLHEENV